MDLAKEQPKTATLAPGDTVAANQSPAQRAAQAVASPARRVALALSAVAFFAWIAWLAYLAATASNPLVLSRPQLLISDLDVSAEVESLDSPVTVVEVFWPPAEKGQEGKKLLVTNLPDMKDRGWEGPGRYLLPLLKEPEGTYQVAPIPPSPGFPARSRKRLIYPDTPHTRGQLRDVRKP